MKTFHKKYISLVLCVVVLGVVIAPHLSKAFQSRSDVAGPQPDAVTNANTSGTGQSTVGAPGAGTGQSTVGNGAGTGQSTVGTPSTDSIGLNFTLKNPLRATSLQCLVYTLVNGLMDILAIVAALYIIYSGFMFIAAQGNETKLKAAKTAFFNAVIGTAILLGAWGITVFVISVVNQIVVTNPVPNLPTAGVCQ